jgi:hypothetical protein
MMALLKSAEDSLRTGELEPQSGKEAQLKSILFLFPDMRPVDAPNIIDVVHQQLKPEFMERFDHVQL